MKLSIRIIQSPQGGFVASCPSLPGCRCFGDTRQQAQERLNEAIRGYIAAVGNFVPEQLDRQMVVMDA